MTRWLQDNPIGLGLAAACGVLLLVMVALGIASLLPVDRGAEADVDAAGSDVLALPELAESPPIDAFYVITERPLFNESRQPELESDVTDQLEPPPLAEAEAPDVELSGVVITPSLRMATLRRKDGDRSLVAFEGRPIEGDFGTWQVARVDAREVVLTSEGKELALKLKVHDERIEPPARPAPEPEPELAAEDEATGTEQPAEGERLSRAEEIRRRIAERREELRQQAEMEQPGEQQSAQPSYQSAIQSMIGRSRRNNGDKQEEE